MVSSHARVKGGFRALRHGDKPAFPQGLFTPIEAFLVKNFAGHKVTFTSKNKGHGGFAATALNCRLFVSIPGMPWLGGVGRY
jgi:hypothetical protein